MDLGSSAQSPRLHTLKQAQVQVQDIVDDLSSQPRTRRYGELFSRNETGPKVKYDAWKAVSTEHPLPTRGDATPSPQRKPWVVGRFKNRVPSPEPGVRKLRFASPERDKLKQNQAHISSDVGPDVEVKDFHSIQQRLDAVLALCERFAEKFGSAEFAVATNPPKDAPFGLVTSEASSGTVLTLRSKVLYSSTQVPAYSEETSSLAQLPDGLPHIPLPVEASSNSDRYIAPVALNKPTTVKSGFMGAGPLSGLRGKLATLQAQVDEAEWSKLGHREQLRAGIAELNAEFFAALTIPTGLPG